jgi:hypothetical protein
MKSALSVDKEGREINPTTDFNERLNRIESRLTQLESGRIILEEREIPSAKGEIKGKTYLQTPDGGVIKEVRIGICDACGRRGEEFNICVSCGHKLCEGCSVSYRRKIYCRDCLSELLPLTKEEYKILLGISKGITTISELNKLTKIRKAEVRAYIESLTEKEFIEKASFLFFSNMKVLEKGLEALTVYRQVYGRDEDVIQFESEVVESENI